VEDFVSDTRVYELGNQIDQGTDVGEAVEIVRWEGDPLVAIQGTKQAVKKRLRIAVPLHDDGAASNDQVVYGFSTNVVLTADLVFAQGTGWEHDVAFSVIAFSAVKDIGRRKIDEFWGAKIGGAEQACWPGSMSELRDALVFGNEAGIIASGAIDDHLRMKGVKNAFAPSFVTEANGNRSHSVHANRSRLVGEVHPMRVPQGQGQLRTDRAAPAYDEDGL
jgi:hypothetical protein